MLPKVPVPRHALRALGQSDAAIDRALRAGGVVAPFRGVLVAADHSNGFLSRCRAALATQDDDAVISHRTAAVLLQLPWVPQAWSSEDAQIDVSVTRDDRHRLRTGLRLRHAAVSASDVRLVSGIRVTSPARTLVDVARDPLVPTGRLLCIQLLDGARRAGRCEVDELGQVLDAAAGLRNIRRAREWVGLSVEGVDSPAETACRIALLDNGVPHLKIPVEIRDEDGLLVAKCDFGDEDCLIWGEYDGYDTHIKRDVFRKDRRGDRWLSGRGWHVFRVVDQDLRAPARLAREWLRVRADAPARIAALDPSRSPEVARARRVLGLDG